LRDRFGKIHAIWWVEFGSRVSAFAQGYDGTGCLPHQLWDGAQKPDFRNLTSDRLLPPSPSPFLAMAYPLLKLIEHRVKAVMNQNERLNGRTQR